MPFRNAAEFTIATAVWPATTKTRAAGLPSTKRRPARSDDSQTTEVQSNQPLPNLFGGDAPKFSESGDEVHLAAATEPDKNTAEDSAKDAAKPAHSRVK